MSNVATNNVLDLIVGGVSQPATIPALAHLLGKGQVGAYKESGQLADGTESKFHVARGGDSKGEFVITDVIDMSSKGANSSLKVGTADQSQVTYIGFNGFNGDIDVIPNNLYYVRFNMQELLGSASDARVVKSASHESGNSTTSELIAVAIAASTNANMSADPEHKVNGTVINDAADDGVAISGAVFSYGSRVVSATAHGLSVGDRIRLATSGLLTESTFLVAKIIDPNAFEITNKWGSFGISINVFRIPAANITGATKFGIKFIGQPLDWTKGKIFNNMVFFELSAENFGSSFITKETGAKKGNMTGREVSDLETFTSGFTGEQYRVGEPALFGSSAYVNPNILYDGHRYSTVNDEVVGIGATPTSRKEVLVALPQSESASPIAALLTALLV